MKLVKQADKRWLTIVKINDIENDHDMIMISYHVELMISHIVSLISDIISFTGWQHILLAKKSEEYSAKRNDLQSMLSWLLKYKVRSCQK